jgi:hypothetical protein
MVHGRHDAVEVVHKVDKGLPDPCSPSSFIWEAGLVIAGCLVVVVACDWIAVVFP